MFSHKSDTRWATACYKSIRLTPFELAPLLKFVRILSQQARNANFILTFSINAMLDLSIRKSKK